MPCKIAAISLSFDALLTSCLKVLIKCKLTYLLTHTYKLKNIRYSRILDRIAKELGQHKWKAVKTILAWMVYSSRNMKRFELLSAISLRLGSGSVGYYAYEWEWALYTCKPLLEETKSGTVTFTHSTVHE